jgi:hypothetical protein
MTVRARVSTKRNDIGEGNVMTCPRQISASSQAVWPYYSWLKLSSTTDAIVTVYEATWDMFLTIDLSDNLRGAIV